MSKNDQLLIIQVAAVEVRAAKAVITDGLVTVSASAAFTSKSKAEFSALCDASVRDALTNYVDDNELSGVRTICLFGGPAVTCQHFDMPPLKGAALKQAATLKLGSQLHFDVESAVVAVNAEGPGRESGQVNVRVSAVHQDAAMQAVELLQALDLRLVALSAVPSALAAQAVELCRGNEGLQAVLFVDEGACTLMVLENQRPVVMSDLPIGISEFVSALMRPIIAGETVIQLDAAAALALRDQIGIPSPAQKIVSLDVTGDRLLPLLEPVLQKLSKQITQWLSFASTSCGGAPVRSLRLVGPGSRIAGLAAALTSRLQFEVTACSWLDNLAAFCDQSDDKNLESFAFAVAAARHGPGLPDLIPPEIQKQRKVACVREGFVRCAPIVAAASLAIAFLFNGIYADLRPATAKGQEQFNAVQQLVGENTKWASFKGQNKSLVSELDDFIRRNPSWNALFKELSLILPPELRAVEYTARPGGKGIVLVVKAAVYPNKSARTFDEIVSQTTLALQRSAFFRRVELSANRGPQKECAGAAGAVSIELDLAYPTEKAAR